MEYNFKEIEQRWKKYWEETEIYKVTEDLSKPKFYVLNMFPYPSGAGLHVGHPLGYIASDIFSRYKRSQGFNVLHPMGYDAYGLPAEQYAIQTGQHPAITTNQNIDRYREQLDKIGFSYDWSREIRTNTPDYYKWTQWTFIQMFNSYFDNSLQKAQPIAKLIEQFEQKGTEGINVSCSEELTFTALEWKAKSEKEQQEVLLNYRIAYLADTKVNWCPALGTVLANDEVINGLSERGGHPVEQRMMRQWNIRVSAYAQRLLDGLDKIEWTDSLKETQRNWIGRSDGAEMKFQVKDSYLEFEIFTTRADTIFGVTFMVLAPESEYVAQVTTDAQKTEVDAYIDATKKRTERDRLMNKQVTGAFTGSYAINPLNGKEIPIWVADYVLAGYGTGAIMAVPAHDSRDYAFAKKFDLEILPLIEGCDVSEESFDAKDGIMVNSGFLNGLTVKEAIAKAREYIEENNLGHIKTNYRLRDAIFSRQRYWGEPFPVYYKDGMPCVLPEEYLPLELPSVDKFLPTETGEPPLGRATDWAWDTENKKVVNKDKIDGKSVFALELNTMPGFAGSSAYFLRYMDPRNEEALVAKDKVDYWKGVDLYLGGTEHATGHLIYSRFWNMFLFDNDIAVEEEPFKKLINQGMIQGRSNFVYRVNGTNTFVSLGLIDKYETTQLHVDVNIVENDVLDIEKFKAWRPEFNNAEFILEDGKYICSYAVEKMSKSYFNVVNPDDMVERYGADTLRLYEMFLGPLEQSKPWDTNGIDGVSRFLRKTWGLFYSAEGKCIVNDDEPTKDELKTLHTLIKKVTGNIESFAFNTSVSAFMICVNELSAMKCSKKAILRDLLITLAPFAPFISEELWKGEALKEKNSIVLEKWVKFNEAYLVESVFTYAISFNGKARFNLEFSVDASKEEIEKAVFEHPSTQKWMDGKTPKKVIVVPKKIVNIVL